MGAAPWGSPEENRSDILKGNRQAYIPDQNRYAEIPVYDRYQLTVGVEIVGPAIIEERESTLVLNGPGKTQIDTFGNVIVHMG